LGLLKNITNRVLGTKSESEKNNQEKQEQLRRCYFEVMEQRRVLSADPVIAAVTYLEGDSGQDTTPDHFEVSFEGGGETTQLTQFTINGDQDSSGTLSDGDMFFDANSDAPGAAGSHDFVFDAANSSGVTAADVSSFSVSDDGLVLTVSIDNFEAGDVFAFTIDVDEVERFRTDKIASGVEFEGTFFNASFVDENYTFEDRTVAIDATLIDGFVQPQQEGIFYDEYDALFDEGERVANDELKLSADNENGTLNRTAGAIDAYSLVPKPVSISGNVYHDEDLDCEHDANEDGIEGVSITLQRLNTKTGQFDDVATTLTDASGHYEFGDDLGLQPGTFRLVETQPDGYLNVGESAGTHGGEVSKNVISNIQIPNGGSAATDYDFKEVLPASLSGNVWHDVNDNGVFESGEPGIANVLIQVTRVGAKDAVTKDPFEATDPITVRTDANGHYSIDLLPPGIYEIVEINDYPDDADPLAAYLDGQDSTGNVDGTTVGTKSNDKFSQIVLCAGEGGVHYDFGEVQPAQLAGTVWHDANNDGVIDPTEDRIGGVVIELFDKSGNKISETRTNAEGDYAFENLYPGEYIVRETQPGSFIDGKDVLGEVNGVTAGDYDTNDEFCVKLGSGDDGTNYDFGELKPSSISGTVHGDANGNCIFEASEGDRPLEGVELVLLDGDGNELARTKTDANGDYSFDNLMPGAYSVREVTPEGYIDGAETIGQVDGESRGTAGNDLISGILIASGEQGVNYDFCEHIPAQLCGTVYHDRNDNGVQDSGEEGIEGTRMVLTDADGNLIAETFTDAEGGYCFTGLLPGVYCVKEIQPDGYVDGLDSVGTVGSVANGVGANDEVCKITLTGGDEGQDYNFGEIKLAEISGRVHVDNDGNCVYEPGKGDRVLADVELELLDVDGNVIATTMTDANGNYSFSGIMPGEYAIRQAQPDGFFNGGQVAGSGGGDVLENLIENISVISGQKLINYDFCEVEAAEIHGRVWEDGPAIEASVLPENYRDLRDGVYDADVDTPLSGVRMELFYYIDPANGDIDPRAVTLSEVQAEHYAHMDTTDPDAPVWVETMANGEYWFMGLQAGNYIVLENQPDGYIDSNDTPGTTTGFSYNSSSEAQTAAGGVLLRFSGEQIMDSVVNIRVNAGGISEANNFSEVTSIDVPVLPPPNPPQPPTPPGNPQTPSPGITGFPGLLGSQPSAFTQYIGNSRGASFQTEASSAYTWHLSVVNAGLPRGADDGAGDESVWQQAGFISNSDWGRFDMDDAVWNFTQTSESDLEITATAKQLRFGMLGGIPLSGDFDGDGTDELAVFKDGFWMIDINRNGTWDEGDLLARLGNIDDQPVVGDWDGDGKDDIGIYGPIWERDREAIERDPGLPNPDNNLYARPKNIPPMDADATNGSRVMKLTSYGKQRSDVVDHVFGVGSGEEIPVTGDWNGNGIRSIGTFQNGLWQMDVNGDGRFDSDDSTAEFGRPGDIPVVGDFDGDGVEEIAVYRAGSWMIDTNGNRELDATDKTFQMGGAADKPVVGDWDGDGIDEPGTFTEDSNTSYQ
jgi:serine-aspartate repeat-containing protein C/D/E